MPEIVGRFLEEAKKGSIPHTRMLTILGGFANDATVASPDKRPRSLAALLMRELKSVPRHETKTDAVAE